MSIVSKKIVATHLIIDIVLLVLSVTSVQLVADLARVFLAGMIVGQIPLLAAWLGFSKVDISIKVVVLTASSLLFGCTGGMATGLSTTVEIVFTIGLMVWMLSIMAALFLATCHLLFRVGAVEDLAVETLKLQFSTRTLMLLTAGVAGLLTFVRIMRSISDDPNLSTFATIFSLPFSCWLAMVPLLWAGLGAADSAWRAIAGVLLAPLVAGFPIMFTIGIWSDALGYWVLFSFSAIVIIVTLLYIRTNGVRLVRVDSWLTRAFFYRQTA